jgi:hypothetical protein
VRAFPSRFSVLNIFCSGSDPCVAKARNLMMRTLEFLQWL